MRPKTDLRASEIIEEARAQQRPAAAEVRGVEAEVEPRLDVLSRELVPSKRNVHPFRDGACVLGRRRLLRTRT